MELPREIEDLMTVAVKEAGNIQSEAIEPIHLFIAVCKLNPPLVAEAFQAQAIDPELLRRQLRAFADAECPKHSDGPKRVSARVMDALDKARAWSKATGHPLGIAGVLITLLELPDDLLKTAYSREGLPVVSLVAELNERLLDEKKQSSAEAKILPSMAEKRVAENRVSDRRISKGPQPDKPIVVERVIHPSTPILDLCGKDYTWLALNGKIDPVIGRRQEINRVIRILLQKQKNNPALVGDAGVGKTTIVEGLALRAAADDAPREIRDWRIVELLLTALVAGTIYRGELEQRLHSIMNEVESDPQLVLFIDELHTLIGGGAAIGAMDIANILKPALARGQMRVIGATTTGEYRRYIEKDPALERRFQPVRVEEPTPAQARKILQGLRPIYESHHGVRITDEALDAAVELSVEYLTDRRLPDKARDLLDQAAVKKRFLSLTPSKVPNTTLEVTREDIAEMVSEWIGIPLERLFFRATSQPSEQIEEALKKRVIGQDEAVTEVARAVRTALAGLAQRERPSAVFFFMGPTGVGKTEMAKALAGFLFGDERRLIRFDMSQFMEEHAVSKFIGSPPGYVGHDEGGLLTDAVRSRPYSVILFDEIEKAHPRISDLFLQVFDEGRLTDSRGRTADFRNTIIILTSNIFLSSSDPQKQQRYGFRVNDPKLDEAEDHKPESRLPTQDELRKTLLKHFRPEFINRINKLVQFRALGATEIRTIIDKIVGRVQQRLADKDLRLELLPTAYEALTQAGHKPEWGARELERVIEHQIVEPLAQGLLSGRFKSGETVYVFASANGVTVTNQQPDEVQPGLDEKYFVTRRTLTQRRKEES